MAWSARPPARVVLLAKFDLVSAMRRDRLLQRACDEADLVLAGERTFDLIARLEGRQPLPAVAAIDLVEPLMRAAEASGRSVFLFGLPVEVGHRAARRLRIRYPDLRLAGLYGPPEGFERDPRLNAELAFILRSVRPDIVLVGLETGVQEVWAAGMADAIRSGVFVTLGDGLRTWARADREARALSFYRAALAWLGAVVAAALRVGRKLVALPALVRFHRTDRARYGAAQRRRLIALQTEERYRRARIVTRQADTDAALRTRYGMEETR
ncbi:MAG: WecB/TagA/CpsF family glycosyltransferase [Pseudomonadota bacterium]